MTDKKEAISKLLASKGPILSLSATERKKLAILVIDQDHQTRTTFRQTLSLLDYEAVYDSPDHLSALQKVQERQITHIIFDAKKSNMPAKEFVTKALEFDNKMVLIAASYEPTVDDVFDLLIHGARGYLVKPFTSGTLDDAIVMATKGEPISEAILYAKDRNEALASLILTAFDRLATTSRQARHFETAKLEIPRLYGNFRRSVDIGLTFAKGGDDALAEAIIDFCLERSNGPATRLGRVRQRMRSRELELAQKAANELRTKDG